MDLNTDWIEFYQSFANELLKFKGNQKELLSKVKESYSSLGMSHPFIEADGSEQTDVCPFTVMATFNKQITEERRFAIIEAYKKQFNVNAPMPTGFDSIPVVNNLSAWFYAGKKKRLNSDINNLWDLFEAAIDLSKQYNESNKSRFIDAFDKVSKQRQVKWNITFALYWIRPFDYLNLDSRNRNYLFKMDNPYKNIVKTYLHPNKPPKGGNYLEATERIKALFSDDETPHNNFSELSYAAYLNPSYESVKNSASHPLDLESSTKKYWLYAPGRDSKYWDEFYEQDIMAIGWSELGDIRNYKNKSEVVQKLREINHNQKSYKNDVLALWQFANEMNEGDIVFVKQGTSKLLGRGEVVSEYFYDESLTHYNKIRKVKWTHKGEWMYPGQAPIKTLTNISSYLDDVDKLESIFSNDEIDGEFETHQYDAYTPDEFLDDVFMSTEKYSIIVSLLHNRKNLILQGPPGVGKTFAAKRIAYSMMNEKDYTRVKMIQFHQSYSYEDFVMGYRPTENSFELKHGPFYNFCKTAEQDSENDYFFIIDEINRGNLSKIFGELLMLIEGDKRDEKIKLMYKDELFSVPNNLYVIGLMNTADRSLAIIDYALRRRFAFVDLVPAFESTGFKVVLNKVDNYKFNTLIRTIKQLNEIIAEDENLGEGYMIGHSYFTIFDNVSDERLKSIIEYEIIPLIKEYWFDDKEKVRTWSSHLLEVFND